MKGVWVCVMALSGFFVSTGLFVNTALFSNMGLSGGTGLFISRASAEYSGERHLADFLPCITGVWVDENGHRRMDIFSGQNGVNTCRVMDMRDWQGDAGEGSAVIIIMEKQGVHEMSVEYHRNGGDSWLLLDGRLKMVPEQQEKRHAESVGGVTLDMPMMQLLQLYGAPYAYLKPEDTQALCGVSSYGWHYKNEGWLVTFDSTSGTVDRIFLFPGSTRFLDNTVLNCDSPLERFAGLYGFARTPAAGDNFPLGEQEYLSFAGYPDYICLTIYQ